MASFPALTPPEFDRIARKDRRLDGLKAIGSAVGRSDKTIRRWIDSGEVDIPVYRVGGRWIAFAAELAAWERQAPT